MDSSDAVRPHARRPSRLSAEDAEIAKLKASSVLGGLCALCGFVFLLYGAAILAAAAASPVTFTDATARAGVTFVHTNGAFGKKYLPETLGAGGLFLDIDGDGWQDMLLINSTRWPGHPGAKTLPALYRNNHDGTFSDVTRGSGLDVELYGIGGTAADFDNDGKVDVYVTALGGNRLFRNLGGGKFADVTGRAGVADAGFSTSAA